MTGPIVELKDVFLRNDRGGHVFRDLNLTIEAGRSAVITGAAGSGKTSLAELLIGVRFAESGLVILFDEVMKRGKKRIIKRVRKKIGGVGGVFGLLPSLTVAENITLPMVISGVRKKIQQERLLKLLSEFSLLKQAGEYPPNLTRVESYLVQFARASIAGQPLIIIDEPSAGLDRKTYERIFEYLVKVSLSGRSMIILTSEIPSQQIPETDYYQIENGALV
ncbi:MAG: ATP-binding cassette domain-containing protein [candidate division Zixibacteria bacterium]|nr:ATP-binding cassette domain-containing protein [candidate division Zixibacteria bacterium]